MEVRPVSIDQFNDATIHHRDNFFGSTLWCKSHGPGILPLGIFRKGMLIGTFILYRYKKLGKSFLINPPLAPHCGLKLELNDQKCYRWHSDVKRAMKAIASYLLNNHSNAVIDFCLPPGFMDAQPFQWEQFLVLPRYTYRLNVAGDDEDILRQMSPERRKNIRDALRGNYEVKLSQGVDDVLGLVAKTMKRAGLRHHAEPLNYLSTHGGEDVYHVVVYGEGQALAAAKCCHDDLSCHYLAGGHDHQAADSLAGTLALWSAIQEAHLCGCKYFDFNGSSEPSIERYFRGFGGELTCYLRIQRSKGLIPWLQKAKLKYRKRA